MQCQGLYLVFDNWNRQSYVAALTWCVVVMVIRHVGGKQPNAAHCLPLNPNNAAVFCWCLQQ